MKRSLFVVFISIFFAVPRILFASENQFVTIVNPVRIAPYTENSAESIKAQYSVISSYQLPATWLLRYDVLENDTSVSVVQTMDDRQELGIFLEVTKKLAEDSGVMYPEGSSWHHANAIFLSGYSQSDREKMIDRVFELFFSRFGYYPKSVGSWWTDAYSLSYMKNKYGITGNLTCSDQFATDGYQIWGQYWMYPYYPSKNHAGIPGYNKDSQIGVVTIQWAPREPLRGYESSLYSTQDYQTYPLAFSTTYFEQLIKTYGYKNKNAFGQITVGLEGDYNPRDYQGEYKKQIAKVNDFVDKKELTTLTMAQFSQWYTSNSKETPMSLITSDTFDSAHKSFWISTKNYRIGFVYDDETKETKIIDFRTYHSDFREPYYVSPNKEHELSIYIPSYIDWANNKESMWTLALGQLHDIIREGDTITFKYEEGELQATDKSLLFTKDTISVPTYLLSAKTYDSTKTQNTFKITYKEKWLVPEDGIHFTSLSQAGKNELARKRTKVVIVLSTLLFVGLLYITTKKIGDRKKKVFAITILTLTCLSAPCVWYQKNSETFYVSQAEIDALSTLSGLPTGNILIYDKKCLGCHWSTPFKYAVYENKRSYVSNLSKKKTVQNQLVFEASTQEEAKREFQGLNARYIYLVKYEDYQEKIPFSPGDLSIEKIYDNANAEIWRVR